MIYKLGPRALRVYNVLQARIIRGEFPPGTKLPPHTELAADFGVAPLTMRQVLGRLEEDHLVSREQGRGTFVRAQAVPGILILEDDSDMRALLRTHVTRASARPLPVATPAEGLATLEQDAGIVLILSDVRVPTKEAGVEFIRQVRRRWPAIPVAAVTGFPADLDELHGTAECPVLILPKPIWAHQIEETLALVLHRS
ncbi:MAG TPA: GntR family transcriptional regulator [Chloroflexia bacterium]|nr:GntR family transcriptional regulator [Chloroflexia bacterium]